MSARIVHEQRHDDGARRWALTQIAPPAHLARDVDSYRHYEETTGTFCARRELPHTRGVLIFNLGDPITVTGGDGRTLAVAGGQALVAGFHLGPAISAAQQTQRGIQIDLPLLTLRRLLGVPMDLLVDQALTIGDLLGSRGEHFVRMLAGEDDLALRAAIIDEALAAMLVSAKPASPRLRAALALLAGGEGDIMDIARQVGWSRKHLAEQVRDAVGVGPRSFRRVVRFERAVNRLAEGVRCGWAGLAAEAGYCDQSHMIREFRELAGMTPAALVRTLDPASGFIAT